MVPTFVAQSFHARSRLDKDTAAKPQWKLTRLVSEGERL